MGTERFGGPAGLSLVVLALGAFAMPLLVRRLRFPGAVGEILFGVLVGPHALAWVQPSHFIDFLSQLGFFLLMFLAGLELDFRRLESGGWRLLWRALRAAGLVYILAALAVTVAGWPPFVGLVLSATSIGVPLSLLQEMGQAKTEFGQHVLLIGSLGEFSSILLATGLNAYALAGGFNADLGGRLLALTALFAFSYLLLVILRTAVWWYSDTFARVVDTRDPSEVGVRAGLALMFSFVAITASMQIEPILGAFLAGALFSFVFRDKGPLELKFLSLGNGFFVPFFYISVGLSFDLPLALQGNLGLSLRLLGLFFSLRAVAFLVGGGFPRGGVGALCGALVLSAPLTLLVVLANLGASLQLVDASFQATIILLAVTCSTLYPLLAKAAVWARLRQA